MIFSARGERNSLPFENDVGYGEEVKVNNFFKKGEERRSSCIFGKVFQFW